MSRTPKWLRTKANHSKHPITLKNERLQKLAVIRTWRNETIKWKFLKTSAPKMVEIHMLKLLVEMAPYPTHIWNQKFRWTISLIPLNFTFDPNTLQKSSSSRNTWLRVCQRNKLQTKLELPEALFWTKSGIMKSLFQILARMKEVLVEPMGCNGENIKLSKTRERQKSSRRCFLFGIRVLAIGK